MSDSKHFFQDTALISTFTLLSRVLGLVRDVACAAFFGGGLVWDAFSFAFRVPNLFRHLFGEGALNSAFIPTFTEYLETKDRNQAWRLAWAVGTALSLVLVACLLLGETVVLLIPRLAALSARWNLTLTLTAVLLPYMVFICLTALGAAMLQSLKRFTAPALAPVILNVFWIVSVLVVAPAVAENLRQAIFILAAAILCAGVVELALQLFVLGKAGMPWDPVLDLLHPGLRKIAITMLPVVLGMAAYQLNALLDGVIAIGLAAPEGAETFELFGVSFSYPLRTGANSALYYANRLTQFPLGVFGIALATAIFPTLSSRAANDDMGGYRRSLREGLGAVLFIGIPAGVGLIILARPTIEMFFERGEFTGQMTRRTVLVLSAYSTGIWAYCAHHVLSRAFYSLQDTRTPAKVAAAVVVLNLVLNLTLIWWLSAAGLALATAISTAVQSCVLYAILIRRVGSPGHRRLIMTFIKTVICTVFMAAITVIVLSFTPTSPESDLIFVKLLRLSGPLAAGTVSYFLLAAALRVPELTTFLSALHGVLSSRDTLGERQ
ncbi:MAG: murein biosynthesis integral membrane protein MurJ [Planctomycetota bacterium]